MNKSGVLFVFAGMVIGCGAMAAAPVAKSWASPPNGYWGCYQPKEFPDPESARSDDDAKKVALGLTRVAAHVPTGQILAVSPDSSYRGSESQIICVKY